MKALTLKYGCNPNQSPAEIRAVSGQLPFTVLNGTPGYINFMDALNSWQLVREVKAALAVPAAASFKHVSPAGAAVAAPLSAAEKQAYFVGDLEISPLASAYIRARGADRMSSFGDWAALSDIVDEPTALVLQKEVSDGIIAPGYTPAALAILNQKKGGKYNVIQIDPEYEPAAAETRLIFGLEFTQRRNTLLPAYQDLENIVTAKAALPEAAKRDMLLAMLTLKYTQSNSVCYVANGQVIGCGAGQQSRIHCTRLAGDKADIWFLKQHPRVLSLPFKPQVGKPDRNNAVDVFVRHDSTDYELQMLGELLESVPERLTPQERTEWLAKLDHVTLGSDAFFPFRDNIDRAAKSGVKYVVQPGGSVRDEAVIGACNEYGMVMAMTGQRLFHH